MAGGSANYRNLPKARRDCDEQGGEPPGGDARSLLRNPVKRTDAESAPENAERDHMMRTSLRGRDSILVIVGPRCGTAVAPATVRELLGPDVRACWATRSGEATDLAGRFGVEHSTICVFGGDGTVSEVINGLWQIAAESALAIFPAGTSNVLACHFGCPTFRA